TPSAPTVASVSPVSSASSVANVSSASGIFSALRYRNYRLFWFGQLVSVSGTFMQGTAQQWLVLSLSSNAIALGIVGALQFGPMLVPIGGAIADRWPRRNVLMCTQAIAGTLALVLYLLTATGVVQLWHVFVLALLLGVNNAVDMPTRQAFVSEMVPRERLLNAVSLNSAQFNASRIVGPGLAGLLIALFGTPLLFLLNAVSFLAVIVGLWLMHTSELMPVTRAAATQGLARLRAMGDGARFVLTTPKLRTTFLIIAACGMFGFNFNVLLPLEAKGVLHAGPSIFGLLSSALGAGALIGALLLAKRGGMPTNRRLVTMAAAFGLLEASVAIAASVQLVLVLIALTGFFMSTFSASANTRVQLSSPSELHGRIMSVYTMVFIGTTPIGNLLVSAVAGHWGVPVSFAISGIPCLLAALAAAWIWFRPGAAASAQPAASAAVAEVPAMPDMAAPLPGPSLAATADLRPTRPTYPSRLAPGQPRLQPRAADHD
ncbi:MAG TPA: MFS transporter, partial [Ktedonobacterales bacterium]|nr:MFS transporter [Ktedonobacterales bacterium]